MITPLETLKHWRRQARLRRIEVDIELLEADIEDCQRMINGLLVQKESIKREQSPDIVEIRAHPAWRQ